MSNEIKLLKASRIVEANDRLQDAKEQLEKAESELASAEQAAETATDAEAAKKSVDEKKAAVTDAKSLVAYEIEQRNRLIEVEPSPWYVQVITNIQWSFGLFAVLGGIVLFMLYRGLKDEESLLVRLTDIDASRGLITFLITLITVSIALILTLSTIVSASSDRAARFKDGKDLLFALIGVLGAIVGFYFGQFKGVDQQLRISPIVLTDDDPREDESVSLLGFISGGAAPYTYEIQFDPKGTLQDIAATKSPSGLLRQDLKIKGVDNVEELTFEIKVTDSKGQTVASSGNKLTVRPAEDDSEARDAKPEDQEGEEQEGEQQEGEQQEAERQEAEQQEGEEKSAADAAPEDSGPNGS